MPLYRLSEELVFPDPRWSEPDGLLAIEGDLSRERLILAYSLGIFPWYSEGEPVLWWSPDPRMVLFLDELHVSKRQQRLERQRPFEITLDEHFEEVIKACSKVPRPGQDGTWITKDMIAAYTDLHQAGLAHSVECSQDGRLVGGMYGISLGRCFFGESMFSRVPNASKLALSALVNQLRAWNFSFLDCQVFTEHLSRMGAREIPRESFLTALEAGVQEPTRQGLWRFDPDKE